MTEHFTFVVAAHTSSIMLHLATCKVASQAFAAARSTCYCAYMSRLKLIIRQVLCAMCANAAASQPSAPPVRRSTNSYATYTHRFAVFKRGYAEIFQRNKPHMNIGTIGVLCCHLPHQ